MAKKSKAARATNRYGTRYGARNREKVALIEQQYKQLQKCPSCQKMSVKRISNGIFSCTKCNLKFTGRAYSIEASVKSVQTEE